MLVCKSTFPQFVEKKLLIQVLLSYPNQFVKLS